MKHETYIKNKKIFLSRYKAELTFGFSWLDEMLKGIRNKQLFFYLFTYDTLVFSMAMDVSSIDKHTRYFSFMKKRLGSRIEIDKNRKNRLKNKEEYQRVLNYLLGIK